MNPTRSIPQLLTALGHNVGAIVKSLVKLGIKGVPGDACKCALAQYLVHNGYPEAQVSRKRIWPHGSRYGDPVDHPEAVLLFLQGFDGGLFPELIA